MHFSEAEWIASKIKLFSQHQLSPCLNIGSSTDDYRKVKQPFINELIFRPLSERSVKVIHTDIKEDIGVDLVGNLNDAYFRSILRESKFNSIIMSNLLEHVDNPLDFIGYISEISREGCILILTSPYKYPIHMDPGDNNFRPSPNELAKLFSEFAVKESKIIVIDPEYNSKASEVIGNSCSSLLNYV